MYLSAVAKKLGHKTVIVKMADAVSSAKNWKPDVIGYSVMTGDQTAFKEIHKEIQRHIRFVGIWGGAHPSFFPEDFTDVASEDLICRGEGEQWLSEFLCHAGTIEIPYPDRTFSRPGAAIRHFITTRGCPYNCSYCYNQKWAALNPELPRVRVRDVGDVIKEIRSTDAKFVYFQDDCFGINRNWLRSFADNYRGVPYHCHVRPNMVDAEYGKLLSESNCKSVHIALESGNQKLREEILNRDIDPLVIEEAIGILRSHGIGIMLQNIIGIPTGGIHDDLTTLFHNICLQPDYAWVSIYQPYPGTVLGDRCKQEGWYTGDYSEITPSFFDTSWLNISPEYKEQLEVLQKIFALCVEAEYVPYVHELTKSNLPRLVYDMQRKIGDERLFGDIL